MRRPYLREIALAVVAYLIYEGARLLTAGSYPVRLRPRPSRSSAWSATSASTSRARVQRAFLNSPLLTVLNYVYLVAQNLILPASLVFLYRVNRATYRTLRNTLLATWLLALPVYALFPAAPPRLSGLGIADTVSSRQPAEDGVGYHDVAGQPVRGRPQPPRRLRLRDRHRRRGGAARPAAARRRAAVGTAVLLSVVATGNHFVFDAVAGLLITVAGYGAGRLVANGWLARQRRPGVRARAHAARASRLSPPPSRVVLRRKDAERPVPRLKFCGGGGDPKGVHPEQFS